ncbi:PH domain-containing protein [Gandjariella thermophila]|uniref:Membrane protein n=1 Tax=Gandjariella thermophila TaxID=1931992 RepID=A0A4D4J3J1_9PSEU|nr:PH domain-containing protein [Gandjariella thermophila]GDY30024.1 membrane protein [Gandjariella thermophila]
MFAPRDPDEYLLGTERRVIRVRRHWACMGWQIYETIALLISALMISYVLPPTFWLAQNALWYVALFVLLRLVYFVIEWWVERIVVTDKRFMITGGVFTTRVAMMPVSKVTDLTYERPWDGRMMGYGTLIVESAGQIQALNRIEFLPDPERVFDAISELVFGDKKAQQERFSMIKAQRAIRGKKVVL